MCHLRKLPKENVAILEISVMLKEFPLVAQGQQIIFRDVAGSHQLQFYAICMSYPQIACNTNHVSKYRRGIII
jgi:hypothetical protein